MATEKAIEATPTQAQIGPYKYKISFDGEDAYDYNFLGVALYRSKRLKLDPRQADTEIPQTLLHELIHAIGQAYGIDAWTRHENEIKDDKIVDKIDLMASALLQFIRSNPKIVEWLQKQE